MDESLSTYEPGFTEHMVSIDEKLEKYILCKMSKEEKEVYMRDISREISEAERFLRQMEIEVSILPIDSKQIA